MLPFSIVAMIATVTFKLFTWEGEKYIYNESEQIYQDID